MRLNNEELSRLYREQTRRSAAGRDGCLSDEMMVRASAGEMIEAERGRVAEHLSTCSDCAMEYRLIHSLRSWQPQTDSAGTDPERQGKMRVLPVAETRGRWFASMRHAAPLVSAIAASLLIVSLALSAWVVSLHRESQRLSAQIDARDRAIRDALGRLSESATQISQLRRNVDAFLQPQLNAPVIDLDPRDSVRGAFTQTSRMVLIPAKTNVFTLILNVAGQPSFPDYSLEVLGSTGDLIWSGKGLQKSHFDTFTVAVPRSLLTGSEYQFRLYGLRGDKRELIENYRVRIQYQ
jgi:hypothetical protein